jgi:hypothetical protein
MDGELSLSLAVIIGLVILAGCGLDVIARPVPLLAPRAQRLRRHAAWAGIVALYLLALLAL